jgi:uncharacterized protein YbdZ (MbtH family)
MWLACELFYSMINVICCSPIRSMMTVGLRRLFNDEEQHSLWSALVDVPAGWRVVCGEAGSAECLDYAERKRVQPRLPVRPEEVVDKLLHHCIREAFGRNDPVVKQRPD